MRLSLSLILCVCTAVGTLRAADTCPPPAPPLDVLEVGDDKPFKQIETALEAAKEGDIIVIHPKSDASPYRQPALLIRKSKLTLRSADPKTPVVLDGSGFDYSGTGSVPRAVIQFEPEAERCTVEGLTLINARNKSFNAAGIRINQANRITIRNCVIRDNDMGIMSNGKFAEKTGADQRIDACTITDNGTKEDPGYNHNLYLGGSSVAVTNCLIARSVTGHNIKSRAHFNVIVNNRIEHSANRELDLVDEEGNTDVSGSDSFVAGNTIVKDPKCSGNRSVIHFGRDGKAAHNGDIWLIANTFKTPFVSPVLDMDDGRFAVLIRNKIDDLQTGQKGVLVLFHNRKMFLRGSDLGKDNEIPPGFSLRYSDSDELLPIVWSEAHPAPSVPGWLELYGLSKEHIR